MRPAGRELAAGYWRSVCFRKGASPDSASRDAPEAPRQPPPLPQPARPSADVARQRSAGVARAPPPASSLREQLQSFLQLERPQRPQPGAPERSPRGSLRRAQGVRVRRHVRPSKAPARQKPSADPHPDALARARFVPAKYAPAEQPAGGRIRFWALQSFLSSVVPLVSASFARVLCRNLSLRERFSTGILRQTRAQIQL